MTPRPPSPGSQQARVLEMLKAGPISHLQMIVVGIGRGSDVIFKLRRRGYNIGMYMDRMTNTYGIEVHFGRYVLLENKE
jgi:Helix-turn-helix domain